jgi:hypothetical protein
MSEWLSSITTWLVQLVKSIFITLVDFLHDVFIWMLDSVLTVLGALIASIPAPAFLSSGLNIGGLLSGLPPFALYVVGQIRIGEAMAIIAAGVSFYLLRKLFTLGQW